jgi:hypothetical protein
MRSHRNSGITNDHHEGADEPDHLRVEDVRALDVPELVGEDGSSSLCHLREGVVVQDNA